MLRINGFESSSPRETSISVPPRLKKMVGRVGWKKWKSQEIVRSVAILYLLKMAWPLPARTTEAVAAEQDLDSVVSLNISSCPREMVL